MKFPVAVTLPSLRNTLPVAIPESWIIFPVVELKEQTSLLVAEAGPVTRSLATLPLMLLTVILSNVGDDVVAISCGVDKVIVPAPFVTITSLAVPVKVLLPVHYLFYLSIVDH